MKELTHSQKSLKNRPKLTVVREDEPVLLTHLPNPEMPSENPEIPYREIKMPKQPQGFLKAKKHDTL